MLTIERCDPRHPDAMRLLGESQALMQSLFAADECHYLPVDALCADHIAFFIARRGNAFLGTAALADMTDYGELKSMFVTPKARGGPVARALLRQIEDQARDAKRTTLKLETGDRLVAAQAFYRREGFVPTDAFGTYVQNGASVFMQKSLSP